MRKKEASVTHVEKFSIELSYENLSLEKKEGSQVLLCLGLDVKHDFLKRCAKN
jgi:hypothetical protein